MPCLLHSPREETVRSKPRLGPCDRAQVASLSAWPDPCPLPPLQCTLRKRPRYSPGQIIPPISIKEATLPSLPTTGPADACLLPAIHLAVSIPVPVPLPISIADRRAAPTSRPTIPRPIIKIPASPIPVVPSLVSFVPPAPVVSPGECIPLISSGRIPVISPMRIPVVAGYVRVDVLPIPTASAASDASAAGSPAPVSVGVIAIGGRGRAGR